MKFDRPGKIKTVPCHWIRNIVILTIQVKIKSSTSWHIWFQILILHQGSFLANTDYLKLWKGSIIIFILGWDKIADISQTTFWNAFSWMNENVWISLKISLTCVPKVWINKSTLVQIMVWHWPGDKPLSGPMMVSFLMLICITRPQCVKVWMVN